MDSSKDLRGPSQQARPHDSDKWVSDSGWALLWIDGILLVPAIFGTLFLPLVPMLLVLTAGIAATAALAILFSWATRRSLTLDQRV